MALDHRTDLSFVPGPPPALGEEAAPAAPMSRRAPVAPARSRTPGAPWPTADIPPSVRAALLDAAAKAESVPVAPKVPSATAPSAAVAPTASTAPAAPAARVAPTAPAAPAAPMASAAPTAPPAPAPTAGRAPIAAVPAPETLRRPAAAATRPVPVAPSSEPARPSRAAPLRPLERAWLERRAIRLDARRHGAISDVSLVSTLVRAQHADAPAGGALRWLAAGRPVPAVAIADGPARPAPRSMGVAPVLAHSLARRTAEVLAVLSSCLDPAERRAEGHAVRVAYLAGRITTELEMGDDARSDLLYAGLLRDAGSTGLAPEDVKDVASAPDRFSLARRRRPGQAAPPTPPDRPYLSRPDRAAAMVRVLGLPPGVLEAVASAEERWDGHGPRHERHTAIPTGARVLALAVLAAEAAGQPGATPSSIEKVLRRERGRLLEPDLVDRVLALGRNGLWADAITTPLLGRMLELEPLHRVRISDDAGLDAIAGAFADLVDTRTPTMGRHGRRVAEFAARTSVALGLEPRVADDVRRAALLHDIGRLLIPIAFLEKPDGLTDHERRVVDEHAHAGAAVLGRSRVLGGLAPLIAAHHEKLTGTGHFPKMTDDDRELGARIIALADRYEAMTAPRPWRPAMTPKAAWAQLAEETTEPLAVVVLHIMERTLGG